MNDIPERRRAPRTETRLMVRKIHKEEEEPDTQISIFCETRNISRNGAYCISERYFPEFARIRICMELPDQPGSGTSELECEGVVVRSDGKRTIDGKDVYCFAVFFDRMSEEDRQRIDRFVETHRQS